MELAEFLVLDQATASRSPSPLPFRNIFLSLRNELLFFFLRSGRLLCVQIQALLRSRPETRKESSDSKGSQAFLCAEFCASSLPSLTPRQSLSPLVPPTSTSCLFSLGTARTRAISTSMYLSSSLSSLIRRSTFPEALSAPSSCGMDL